MSDNQTTDEWFNVDGASWSNALPLFAEWTHGPNIGAGVYRLIAAEQSGAPRPIPHAGGVDRSGTLYVGQCGSLSERVNELRRALRPEFAIGHHAGARHLARSALAASYPLPSLATCWLVDEDGAAIEGLLLAKYLAAFGEYPPLNVRKEGVPVRSMSTKALNDVEETGRSTK